MSDQTREFLSLLTLPTDIQLLIFQALPDVSTVRALILTNSILYKSFNNNTSSISLAVLSNEVPYAVLPEAVAAWNSSHVKPWNKSQVHEFLKDYHANREAQIYQSWTLLDAFEVSELYQCCRFFASEMYAYMNSNNTVYDFSNSGCLPSSLETRRLERTFLRFELHCNPFGKQIPTQGSIDRFHYTEHREIYFRYYAPWEKEQLACVNDYLYHQISVKLGLRASHGVEWLEQMAGNNGVHLGLGIFYKEYILSMGLTFLQHLSAAETYEQRYKFLDLNLKPDYLSLYLSWIDQRRYDARLLAKLPVKKQREVVIRPFFEDDDGGPEKAWRWTYRKTDFSVSFCAAMKYDLPKWGFCLWDYARLLDCGVFDRDV